MTVPPEPTPAPTDPPEPSGPSEESRSLLKSIVKEAIAELREENAPSPQRTKRAPNFIEQIFGM